MKNQNSIKEFKRAQKHIPGGVNSPVRAFKSVDTNPVYIASAQASRLRDIDNNEYVDFVASWGPMLLGHTHPVVIKAIHQATYHGTSYGAPTIIESQLAELICEMVPSAESVRMVNSGTEATMSALRLARGYTGRELFIKFEGCYHGHADSFLIKAGSGAITLGLPDSPGVTKGTAKDTLIAEYNNIESVQKLFAEYPDKIAAVILEPVAGNMGVVPPAKEFLQALRKLTSDNGALLIFDEVITGFRLAKGGAQEYYNVMPDLTTLGKIIGGGLPVGAYGGRKEIMDMLAPSGPVYQAGTLSGNPLAMAAGYATLKILNETEDFYKKLNEKAAKFEAGLRKNLEEADIPYVINRVGSMMTLFFTDEKEVTNYQQAVKSDTARYAAYFRANLENGVYLAPSQFECSFISDAHGEEELEEVLKSNLKILNTLKK